MPHEPTPSPASAASHPDQVASAIARASRAFAEEEHALRVAGSIKRVGQVCKMGRVFNEYLNQRLRVWTVESIAQHFGVRPAYVRACTAFADTDERMMKDPHGNGHGLVELGLTMYAAEIAAGVRTVDGELNPGFDWTPRPRNVSMGMRKRGAA